MIDRRRDMSTSMSMSILPVVLVFVLLFFFQAEDGIRDTSVTGVQTCALPIFAIIMRQRVMIAVALACAPDLRIADEPTTALDVTVERQILTLLQELRRASGSALMLITHNLALIAEHCDRVAVMYAGEIVEMATTAQLFATPLH